MLKVGITLEGSLEELSSVLQYISDHQKGELLHDIESVDLAPSDEEPMTWTEEKVKSIFRDISYECRRLLKEAAKHEAGITTSVLGKKLGVNEHGIGGILSSLGRQLKNPTFAGLQYPLDWTKDGKYKMIPVWISIITKIVEEQDSIVEDNN